VMNNLQAVLEKAGASFNHVVKTTIFLADLNDFEAVNQVYAQYFEEPYPARSTVQAARLPKGARLEIDAIAIL
jgi:2-iminobutanoate/2-iminopropanoate deaminase